MKFQCAKCGLEHDVQDLAWHFGEPLQWLGATPEEKERSTLTDEQCELVQNGTVHYFIHALLEIPVKGWTDPFVWGVWCSLSESSNLEIAEAWDSPGRVNIGPHFGWLCNRLPGYPDTLLLKTHVHQRDPGLRPLVELEPTDHPIAIDQREGIEPARLQLIVSELLHGHQGLDKI